MYLFIQVPNTYLGHGFVSFTVVKVMILNGNCESPGRTPRHEASARIISSFDLFKANNVDRYGILTRCNTVETK